MKAAQPFDSQIPRRTFLLGGATVLGAAALRNGYLVAAENSLMGTTREFRLDARPAKVEIAPGRTIQALTYDGKLPGTEIRIKEGERVRVAYKNNLPGESTIHWHGIHQTGTNNMDGVPDVTQKPIPSGGEMVYDFVANKPGTYFYHSHFGLDIERGLYAPLIVEPKNESMSYDREHALVLDDWLDGSPDLAFEQLKQGISPADGIAKDSSKAQGSGKRSPMGMGRGGPPAGMGRGGPPRGMGRGGPPTGVGRGGPPTGMGRGHMGMGHGGFSQQSEINYTTYLINGRAPEGAAEFPVKRGERVRFRVINASGVTIFRVAIGGHKLTVTHSDGFPIQPLEVSAFEIAPGERYDFFVTAGNPGAWPIAAVSVMEPERGARAILRYTDAKVSSPPPVNFQPKELTGKLLELDDMLSPDSLVFPLLADRPDRVIDLMFRQNQQAYAWTIAGSSGSHGPFEIRSGERVRVRLSGGMMMRMWHPMHLHGHSFRVVNERGNRNTAVKDTVLVKPKMHGRVELEFLADNPGNWLFHCHHAYHLAAGMECVFKYV